MNSKSTKWTNNSQSTNPQFFKKKPSIGPSKFICTSESCQREWENERKGRAEKGKQEKAF